ncbi:hypothetical protein H4R18_004462 [Coemansia javaensis]|uniref:Uncharacterized protein n=1 Tax=Coemansia javaensis TaxID=2761396 RepID=A0A9W8H8Z1_9FUNG|nr:hypothetical protein H4R18_004462 [Coemansia javaensis]
MHVVVPMPEDGSAARRLSGSLRVVAQQQQQAVGGGGGPLLWGRPNSAQGIVGRSGRRLDSVRTQASSTNTTSSKNTDFYSAQSHFGSTEGDEDEDEGSFHTAAPPPPPPSSRAEVEAAVVVMASPQGDKHAGGEEALVHAIATQYVLDAEAAGSHSPSYRSRQNTEASRALGADRATTASTYTGAAAAAAGGGYPRAGVDYDTESGGHPSPAFAERRAYERSLSEKDSRSDSEEQPPLSQRLRDEEVDDDENEASRFVPARMRHAPPQYTVKADGHVPAGAVLFACGFVLLPLWWVGAVFPRAPGSDVARTWRKYNALMSLLSLPLLGLLLALGGWHAAHE